MVNIDQLDEKNEFIKKTNLLICQYQEIENIIYDLSSGDVQIDNIIKILRDKMFEIEEYYKLYNLPFYKDGILFEEIELYLYFLSSVALQIANKIAKTIYKYNKYYLFNFTSKIADKKIAKAVDEYNELCNIMRNFEIKENIMDVIKFTLDCNIKNIATEGELTRYLKYIEYSLNMLNIPITIEIDEKNQNRERFKTKILVKK